MSVGNSTPIRFAILGAGRRAIDYFVPILRALPECEIVGAWSRSADSASKIGDIAAVPPFTNLDELIEKTKPTAAAVCVNAHANGAVGLTAAERGLHLLLETPIAFDLAEADAIIASAAANDLKVEVAEQFHLRPMEQLKLACIRAGLFGQIHLGMNDFEGHGYHGVSQMRSYLGFDARPVRIISATPKFPVLDRAGATIDEHHEHAIVEFDTGQIGIHHWTSVAYDSPVRGGLGGRFYGVRGSWETSRINNEVMQSIRIAGADSPALTIDRAETDGILASLRAMPSLADAQPIEWRNPFHDLKTQSGIRWSDDEIAVASCVRSLTDAIANDASPRYGALQARRDQKIANGIWEAAREGGVRQIDL